MAITSVQLVTGHSETEVAVISLTPTLPGSLIVLTIDSIRGGYPPLPYPVSSIVDNKSNAYVFAPGSYVGSYSYEENPRALSIWYCANALEGITSITVVTPANSDPNNSVARTIYVVQEFAGAATSPLCSSSAQQNGASCDGINLVTTTDGGVMVTYMLRKGIHAYTGVVSPWIFFAEPYSGDGYAFYIKPTAGSSHAVFTVIQNSATAGASFNAAPAIGPSSKQKSSMSLLS